MVGTLLPRSTDSRRRWIDERCPHYGRVPKDWAGNIAYRREVVRYAAEGKRQRATVEAIAREDPLWAINVLTWTFDSHRLPGQRSLPFITYAKQDDLILTMLAAQGHWDSDERQDVSVRKSRQIGVSWCTVALHWWCWQYTDEAVFHWGSRVEELIDGKGSRSLFWKFDFLVRHLPAMLRPEMDRTHKSAQNLRSGSAITGETANPDFGRGMTYTQCFVDEFASCFYGDEILFATRRAGPRLFVSTPKGMGTAHHRFQQRLRKAPRGVVFDYLWYDFPPCAKGLYTSHDGELEILDEDYEFPPGYEFKLDGRMRSVWYDREEEEVGSRLEMRQEVDAEDQEAEDRFYDEESLKRMAQKDVEEPWHEGELLWSVVPDPETNEDRVRNVAFTADRERIDEAARKKLWRRSLSPGDSPRLRLWCSLGPEGWPVKDRDYSLGVDVSGGGENTPSVISATDMTSGRKVGELVTKYYGNTELSDYARAMQQFFGGKRGEAHVIYEKNGPGAAFGRRLKSLGAGWIYHRAPNQMGWHSTAQTNLDLHSEHRRALAKRQYIQTSERAVREYRYYVMTENTVEHAMRKEARQPSAAKFNHGDICRADALSWEGVTKRPDPVASNPPIPEHSIAGRMRKAKKRERAKNESLTRF